MKYIYLLRHAKASRGSSFDKDIDRPLSLEGMIEASGVADKAKASLEAPEICFTSPAKRAIQTAKFFNEAWGLRNDQCVVHPELYDFEGTSLRSFILNISDEWTRVMVVGHNFAMSDVLAELGGDPEINIMSTSTFVAIAFEEEHWHSLKRGKIIEAIFAESLHF